jgi:hypothetical protein
MTPPDPAGLAMRPDQSLEGRPELTEEPPASDCIRREPGRPAWRSLLLQTHSHLCFFALPSKLRVSVRVIHTRNAKPCVSSDPGGFGLMRRGCFDHLALFPGGCKRAPEIELLWRWVWSVLGDHAGPLRLGSAGRLVRDDGHGGLAGHEPD